MAIEREHWERVRAEAGKALEELFESGDVPLSSLLLHGNGVETRSDVRAILSYLIKYGDSRELSCAVLAAIDWNVADGLLMVLEKPEP